MKDKIIKIILYTACLGVIVTCGLAAHFDLFRNQHYILGVISDICMISLAGIFTWDLIEYMKEEEK